MRCHKLFFSVIRMLSQLALLTIFFLLSACTTTHSTHSAPVSDLSMIEPIPKKGFHRVQKGESLYSLAWRYGLDYRYIIKRNQLTPPYHLRVGQTIYLKGKLKKKTLVQKKPKPEMKPAPRIVEQNLVVAHWRWPAKGTVITRFSTVNKGITIGGSYGEPIFATASGRIVYSGDGLRGYGNLIIIKHNSHYLSAYANNSVNCVKEGGWVIAGQKIAEMGKGSNHGSQLYFEIRKNGKPLNPLHYFND